MYALVWVEGVQYSTVQAVVWETHILGFRLLWCSCFSCRVLGEPLLVWTADGHIIWGWLCWVTVSGGGWLVVVLCMYLSITCLTMRRRG